jgi:hypothetical protein
LARRDTDHLDEEYCGVLLMLRDDPDRLGDIGRRQYGGRDLVQERLEQVIIVAVDHGDIDGSPREIAGSIEPIVVVCLAFVRLLVLL